MYCSWMWRRAIRGGSATGRMMRWRRRRRAIRGGSANGRKRRRRRRRAVRAVYEQRAGDGGRGGARASLEAEQRREAREVARGLRAPPPALSAARARRRVLASAGVRAQRARGGRACSSISAFPRTKAVRSRAPETAADVRACLAHGEREGIQRKVGRARLAVTGPHDQASCPGLVPKLRAPASCPSFVPRPRAQASCPAGVEE